MPNQSPTVSFIIPVYNSETYIAECLDSILRQTVQDIEIICINDCSSDSSATILNEYAARDRRVKIINLTTNEGPGNARNIGIEHASCDFIRMVDADDFIPLDSTEKLLDAATKHKSDFVKGGYRHCTSSGNIRRRGGYPSTTVTNISAGDHCLLWHFDQHTTFLFNAEILKSSGTHFDSTMRNGEDVVFLAALAPHMRRVTSISDTVYYYRTHKKSTTRKKRDIVYFNNIFGTYSAVYEHRINEQCLESADFYLFHRLTGAFASDVLPSIYNDLEYKETKEILTVFKSLLTKFDIMPRILTHPYSWRDNILISNEIIYLMTMVLHADLEVATSFFYYLNENRIGKRIRTTKEKVLRKKILKATRDLNNIQTSTSWRLSAPLRYLVNAIRKINYLFSLKQGQENKLPNDFPNHRRIFEQKFIANSWISDESVSGRGSTLEQTRVIRQELPKIINKYQIRTVVDIPCGDFYWMSTVDLAGIEYLGLDIVEELIQTNKDLYENGTTISFSTFNILEDSFGDADLILSRDCLVHFCFDDIFKALANIKKNQVTYLLTTTFPGRTKNEDIETGLWRPLNLQASPFNFPAPLIIINENNSEARGKYQDKSLGLWKISDL